VDGWLFPGESASADDLVAELDAARRAGVAVELAHDPPFDAFPARPCLRFPRQARIHALKFLGGLARRFDAVGGRIHTGTHVTAVHGGAPVRVETDGGATVLASACVVATNSPISDRVRTHLKQAPYRTFALSARVPSGAVPDALYWEDADPYIYVRTQPGDGHDWLIVGGQDYKTGQKEDDRSGSTGSKPGRGSGSPWWRASATAGPARSSSPRTDSPSSAPTPTARTTSTSSPATPATA
jgi:hypothetical protein